MPNVTSNAAYQQILSMAVEDRSTGYQDMVSNNNALLASNVESCGFVYNAASSSRNGLLTLTIKLTSGGESVTLLHQVHLDNSP
jgi:hypothetical protein